MPGFTPVVVALALAQAEAAPPAAPAAATPESAASPEAAPPAPARVPAAAPAAPPASTSSDAAVAAPAPAPAPAPRPRLDPAAERAEAERAARAFLAALATSDAGALAAAAAERFSFDGDLVTGRDAVRARWRALLAARPGPAPRAGALDVVAAQDAVARLGPPPARVAPLARPGTFVAVADVGGRTVVLFLAREAGRMAVLGMHD